MGERVGVIGCGFVFYDVMVSFIEGCGGWYEIVVDGDLVYILSGKELRIYVGLCSGVLFLVCVMNEKVVDY